MNWLTDNPIPLFILGMLAQLVLGVLLWQTGRMWVALLMAGLGIASISALTYEILYLSPTEQIAARLDEIADLLETNDHDRVIACISSDAPQVRASALSQLERIKVEEAAMAGDLRIAFDPPQNPATPEAVASFNGRVKGEIAREPSPYNQFVLRFKVWFRKQNGQWLVTNYEVNPR